MKSDEERKREAESWNNWKPGSGRKGWSPFDKPIPPVRDAATGHPIGKDGTIDWGRVIREANEKDS
jgi:hypothetical protein